MALQLSREKHFQPNRKSKKKRDMDNNILEWKVKTTKYVFLWNDCLHKNLCATSKYMNVE